jgi:hypothetical protein
VREREREGGGKREGCSITEIVFCIHPGRPDSKIEKVKRQCIKII